MEERKTQDRSSSKKPSQERNSQSNEPNAGYSTNVNVADSSAGKHSHIILTDFNDKLSEKNSAGQPMLTRVESVQRSADPKVENSTDIYSNLSNGKQRQVSDQFKGRLGRSQPSALDIQHRQDHFNKSANKVILRQEDKPIRKLLNFHKEQPGIKYEYEEECKVIEQLPSQQPDSRQRSITQFMRIRNQQSQTCLSNQLPLKHSEYDEQKFQALLTFLDEYIENEESQPQQFQKIVKEYFVLEAGHSRPLKKDNEMSERLVNDGTFLSAFVRYSGKDFRDQNVMMAELEPQVKTNRVAFDNYRHRVLRKILYQKNAQQREKEQMKQEDSPVRSSNKKPRRKSQRLIEKQLKKKSQNLGMVDVEVVNSNNEVISVRKSARILKIQKDKMQHDLNTSRESIKPSKRKSSKNKKSKRKNISRTQLQTENSKRRSSKRKRTQSRSRADDTDSSDSTYSDSESEEDIDFERQLESITESERRYLQIEEQCRTPSQDDVPQRSPESPEDLKRSRSRQKVIENSAKRNSNSNRSAGIHSNRISQSQFEKSIEQHSSKISQIRSNRRSRESREPEVISIEHQSFSKPGVSGHSSQHHSKKESLKHSQKQQRQYQNKPNADHQPENHPQNQERQRQRHSQQNSKYSKQKEQNSQNKQDRLLSQSPRRDPQQLRNMEPPSTMPSSAQKARLIEKFRQQNKTKYQVPQQIPCSIDEVINPDINNCGLFALVRLTKASRIDVQEQFALIQLRKPMLKEEFQKREDCINWARKRVDRYFLAIIPITKDIEMMINNQKHLMKKARRKSQDNCRISLGIVEEVPIRVLDGPANRESLPGSKFSKTPLQFISLSRLSSRVSKSKNKSRRSLNPL